MTPKWNYNGYFLIFDDSHSNGTIGETVRCDQKWKNQDGGHSTWITYSSAYTQDSNDIQTAIPMFFGVRLSNYDNRDDVRETGSGKSKMAAIELEVLIYQLVDKIETRFQRLNLSFRGPAIQWNYGEEFSIKLEVKSPRWRPTNWKYLYYGM